MFRFTSDTGEPARSTTPDSVEHTQTGAGRLMKGRLVYIMGPSGAGKDTLLHTMRQIPGLRCRVASRIVTRHAKDPAQQMDDNERSVASNEFLALVHARHFSLHWQANGLTYGIPREIDDWMSDGYHVLVNGSRAYLAEAQRHYPKMLAVLLTVPPALLRKRLLERGRETLPEIETRLARNAQVDAFVQESLPPEHLVQLDNSGDIQHTAQRLATILQQQSSGTPCD